MFSAGSEIVFIGKSNITITIMTAFILRHVFFLHFKKNMRAISINL